MRSLRSSGTLSMLAWFGLTVVLARAAADTSKLPPGSRLAIVGDSITEQRLYSKYIEAYVLACSGVPDVKVFQFGWSGEGAAGFAKRLENDLGAFQPTVVTLCYGMNDGLYQPYNDQIGAGFKNNMQSVLKKLEAMGIKTILVGSPGAVDKQFFRPGQKMGNVSASMAYNDNLAHLGDIDRKLAGEHQQWFTDVHGAMFDSMNKAQAALGNNYDVCGRDGIHPNPNGHLIMAYAFLKGLGVEGQIGEIVVDLQVGAATATAGHQVLKSSPGAVELASSRWPFCFDGDAKSPGGTRSILPYLPFNADLNRFVLKVKGLSAAKAKVTWGSESHEFSREQLTEGVNLAAEFTKTPFDASFQKFMTAVGDKQAFETYMIKSVITNFRSIPPELKDDAELQAALKIVGSRLWSHQQKMDADARALLGPVKHSLIVKPL